MSEIERIREYLKDLEYGRLDSERLVFNEVRNIAHGLLGKLEAERDQASRMKEDLKELRAENDARRAQLIEEAMGEIRSGAVSNKTLPEIFEQAQREIEAEERKERQTEQMEEALLFYADESNYVSGAVLGDGGFKAMSVLRAAQRHAESSTEAKEHSSVNQE